MTQNDINLIDATSIVTDKYASQILVATYKKPKSALELSEKFGIPVAACYRRIHMLEKVGLLVCTNYIRGKRGKRVKLYLSQLKQVNISFAQEKYRVRFILRTGEIKNSNNDFDFNDDL